MWLAKKGFVRNSWLIRESFRQQVNVQKLPMLYLKFVITTAQVVIVILSI